jgi:hypothetical protein
MTASLRPAPRPEPAALRLVVVPTPQPPLEDERIPVRLLHPGVAVPRPVHRPGPRVQVGPAPADDFGPTWSSRSELPDPRVEGRRLFLLTLEALAGRRPLAQVQAVTSTGVFAALAGGRRPGWCTGSSSPMLVGRVHVSEPVDGVAEVSAVARRDGRAHAVAARLEGIDGRWRCTALQIG